MNSIGSLERQLMDAFDEEEGNELEQGKKVLGGLSRPKTKFPYTRRWRKTRKTRLKMARESRALRFPERSCNIGNIHIHDTFGL